MPGREPKLQRWTDLIAALLRRPGYVRFLLDRSNDNRIFALTMLRIWFAYRTGTMRYGIFSATKSPANPAAVNPSAPKR